MSPARATGSVGRRIFLVATEESGDRLGAGLMKVLRQRFGGAVEFIGVGGRAMTQEGLSPLFPIEELSIIGFAAVIAQLPKILRLIKQTAEAVIAAGPDILVIIDMADPTKPSEVGRWWIPGQNAAAGETPSWTGRYALHHAIVVDDFAYGSWRDSHDLGGTHAPFDQSDETNQGAPRGQTQYFKDPASTVANSPDALR